MTQIQKNVMYLCLVDTKLSTNLIIEEIPYVDGDAAPVAAEGEEASVEGDAAPVAAEGEEASVEGDAAPVAAKKAEEEKVEEEEGEGYKKTTVLDNATSSTDVADAVAAKEGDEEGYAKPIVQGDATPDAEVVDTNPNTKATIAPSLLGYNRPSVPADDNDSRSYNKSKKGGAISSDNITKCFGALKNIFESTDMETISSFEVKTVDDIQKNYNSIDENNYNTINITKNENKEDVYDAYYFGIQHNKKTHVSDKVNISKIKDDKINLYETVIMTALWLLGNNKFANYIPQNLIWYILNKNSIDAKVAADAEKAVAAEKKAVEKADEKAAVDAKKAAVEDAKNKIYQITFGNVTINAKIRDNFNFDDEFANNEDNLNGTGKVQTKDGIIINGTWKNGVVEYPYHETDIRGNRYEISISKSKRNGKAVTRVIRKQVYTASGTEIIKTNFIDSNGIMKTIGRYEGQYKVIWNPKTWKKEYVKEGEGKMEYSESLQSYDKHGIYNGKWKDNKRHGKGIMSYNLTTINEYDRYDKNTNEEKLKDLWWNYKSSKTNKPSLVKYFDGKWENDKPKEGKVKYYKTNKVEQYNAVKEKEDKDRREKAAVDAKKARLKDLLKAMFIKNKAVVDVFQKYPTQTVESTNDKDTYDTAAVIADNLVANALKAAENAASATENAVEAAENAASATENAVEAAKNAVEAAKNAVEAAENAASATENAVEAAKNAVEAPTNVVNNRNTYNSIASAYVIALRKIEVVNEAVGAANDAFNAAKDAVVATNAIITGVDDGVS
jgi:hypothetical protein